MHSSESLSTDVDACAARNMDESEIDKQVAEAIDMEDPDILMDLRYQNANGSDKYRVFWAKCKQFLDECTAVHERRHDTVSYMASVRDLIEQVSKICSDNSTPIPSMDPLAVPPQQSSCKGCCSVS